MNQVHKRLLIDVVNPAMKQIAGIRLAFIQHIDTDRKVATINFTDSLEEESMDVQMVRQQGMHESGPYEGDEVLVAFMNNDLTKPIIIGTVDVAYQQRRRFSRDRHIGQGALLSDMYTQRSGENWNA